MRKFESFRPLKSIVNILIIISIIILSSCTNPIDKNINYGDSNKNLEEICEKLNEKDSKLLKSRYFAIEKGILHDKNKAQIYLIEMYEKKYEQLTFKDIMITGYIEKGNNLLERYE